MLGQLFILKIPISAEEFTFESQIMRKYGILHVMLDKQVVNSTYDTGSRFLHLSHKRV